MSRCVRNMITAGLLLILSFSAFANEEPVVKVLSASMRPDSTLMDITYRVDDADNATVKVRALAFVDGIRSFANVIRPVTFVEGTEGNLGDAITTGVEHTLTWNVGADWDVELGNVKFEILCRDDRGLLSFDWISIPAAGGHSPLTISKDTPSDTAVLDALFWQYSDFDSGMTLSNGILAGNTREFAGVNLATGASLPTNKSGSFYIFQQTGVDPATTSEVNYAVTNARAGVVNPATLHAVNRAYTHPSVVVWGANSTDSLCVLGLGLVSVSGISASHNSCNLALNKNGTVTAWGASASIYYPPAGLTGVMAVAAGYDYGLALKTNGTVVGWGLSGSGQINIPAGLTNVTAISTYRHTLALKADGTVVAWGQNYWGEANVPAGLSSVIKVATSQYHSLALKTDGTVVAWGQSRYGQNSVPAGLTNVIAIADGEQHCLALKSDHTIVGWGTNTVGQITIPADLTNVIAIAAGSFHSLALKADGTVVSWGNYGQESIPSGVTNVIAISAAGGRSMALTD